MIKVRHSAGDVGLAREFVRRVQPFVYRPELNFAAIKTALASREKMGSHRRRRLLKQTGPGRHRCEARSRRHSRHRISGAVPAACLWRKRIVAAFAGHNVCAAEAVRQGTHRQQGLSQPHQRLRVPAQPGASAAIASGPADASAAGVALRSCNALARSLAREGTTAPTPEEFLAHVQRRMAAVAEIYQRVIYQEQSQDQRPPEFQLHPEVPATPESSYSQMMQRLAVDSPRLREIAGSSRVVATCTAQSRSLPQFSGNYFGALWRGAALARSGGPGAHHL